MAGRFFLPLLPRSPVQDLGQSAARRSSPLASSISTLKHGLNPSDGTGLSEISVRPHNDLLNDLNYLNPKTDVTICFRHLGYAMVTSHIFQHPHLLTFQLVDHVAAQNVFDAIFHPLPLRASCTRRRVRGRGTPHGWGERLRLDASHRGPSKRLFHHLSPRGVALRHVRMVWVRLSLVTPERYDISLKTPRLKKSYTFNRVYLFEGD